MQRPRIVVCAAIAVALRIAEARCDEPPSGAPTAQPVPAYAPPVNALQYRAPVSERDLVFDSDNREAVLQLLVESRWRPVCLGRCVTRARVGDAYRVSGSFVRASRRFRVYGNPGPLFVNAETRSTTPGVALIVFGAGAMAIGLSFIVTYAFCYECTPEEQYRGKLPGAIVGSVGVFAFAAGIAVSIANRTQLHFGPGRAVMIPAVELGRGVELSASGLRF